MKDKTVYIVFENDEYYYGASKIIGVYEKIEDAEQKELENYNDRFIETHKIK